MKNKFILVFFIFTSALIFAQNINGNKLMESGLNNFSEGNYTLALGHFRDIILDSANEKIHGTAYYWIARSYMAQNLLEKAENNLDFFIQNFVSNKLYPDAIYQKARILFRKGMYDSSVQFFYKFIEAYPEHPYISNSYFWIAESLFELGHLEEAKIIYSMIIREYPKSYKLEAAKYKLSLITLKFRENELLKLLRISHEEYLKALEDFQHREKTYEQTISDYQRKLVSASSDDQESIIAEMYKDSQEKDNTVTSLNKQITQLNSTINDLQNKLNINVESDKEVTTTLSIDTSSFKSERLLELKDSALTLKEYYIDWLASRIGD
ncbi:MAG: tetratricopeptide repeat protein [Spirochaetia bacterium]|nr:tetratricopeptide repeat protein [Spirochaetia bacterium]